MEPRKKSRKQWMLVASAMLTIAAVFLVTGELRFSNNIEVLLPRDPEVLRAFQFFRESPFADTFIVAFELKDEARSTADLIGAVNAFAARVDSPLISSVVRGAETADMMAPVTQFVRLSPQLMNQDELRDLDSKITPPYVREKLRSVYRTLLSPEGWLQAPLLERDPLGLRRDALNELAKLASPFHGPVHLNNGHFVHRDGRRALLLLKTAVAVTDTAGARDLVEYLEGLRAEVPSYVSVEFIAGHLHSISNETVIKRDILLTVLTASTVFLLFFWLVFKDLRAVLMFLIPALSVVIAIHICSWAVGELSAIVMGLAAVISGIAIDYCIHVYVAIHSGQTRAAAVREVSKPLLVAALTTVAVFCAFLFSAVPGYRQLALLSITSILLSLGCAVVFLPLIFGKPFRQTNLGVAPAGRGSGSLDEVAVGIWGVLMIGCIATLPNVEFRNDVRQYDGTSQAIVQTEENFRKIWQPERKAGMLVVEGRSLDNALRRSRALGYELKALLGEDYYGGISQVWPDARMRRENLERWNGYWTTERQARLRAMMTDAGDSLGFASDAFDPFFDMLNLGMEEIPAFENSSLLSQLKERFVLRTADGYRLVHFFRDREVSADAVAEAVKNRPGVFVASEVKYLRDLSAAIFSEAAFLSALIAVTIPLVTCVFLRDLGLVLISLAPVATASLATFAASSLLDLPLNAASIIAFLVVGGLCIDYGIFIVYANTRKVRTNLSLGVTVSALTTVIGASSLLVASHPVLLSFGGTMVVGILAAYLSAIYVVPPLCRLRQRKQDLSKAGKKAYQTV